MKILLIIALVLWILLSTNLEFYIYFKDSFVIQCRYLIFKFNIVAPQKKNNDNIKPQECAQNKKDDKQNVLLSKSKEIHKAEGLSGFLKILKDFTIIAKNTIAYLIKHIKVKKLDLDIKVSQEDSAQTAIKYGQACSIVYPAISLLFKSKIYKPYKIKISPDFNEKKSSVLFHTRFKIRIIYILKCGIIAFFKFIKTFISLKKINNRKV